MLRINNRQALYGLFTIAGGIALNQHKEVNYRIMSLRSRLEMPGNSFNKLSSLFGRQAVCGDVLSDPLLFKNRIDRLFLELERDFHEGKDLASHIVGLSEIATKTESEEEIGIVLDRMNCFLNGIRKDALILKVFPVLQTDSKAYSEYRKEELLKLVCFFSLVNNCINKTTDNKLIAETKINFSNLPYKESRETLASLFMDEKDQLIYLVKALQEKEDSLVDEIVSVLSRELCFFLEKDMNILKKLVLSEPDLSSFSLFADLSDGNKSKLRLALSHRTERRDDFRQKMVDSALSFRAKHLEDFLERNSVKNLKRIAKCKSLFQDQLELSKTDIRIPYWYHATREEKGPSLLQSAKIEVRYKGPGVGYKGAWISSRVESHLFGYCVLALSNKVERIKEFTIGHRCNEFRWRGFLSDIPLKERSMLLLVSVAPDKDKAIQKLKKMNLDKLLQENQYQSGYKICSVKQMNFLQKQITSILGNPNLSSALWGGDKD